MSTADPAVRQQRRGYWLRTLHLWHWVSSAMCLVMMLLFAFTGITLNHAASIEAKPVVVKRTATLPAPVLRALGTRADGNAPLPARVADWLDATLATRIGTQPAEWSGDEVYLSLPRQGGDGWVSIDRQSGAVEYESTSRGTLAYLNDLHKGRNAGAAWGWLIDLFAIACLVFCITGLLLLQLHARQRPSTWPWVAFGLVLPVVLALVFIH